MINHCLRGYCSGLKGPEVGITRAAEAWGRMAIKAGEQPFKQKGVTHTLEAVESAMFFPRATDDLTARTL